MVVLVADVSFLAKNLTDFLIVESLIDWYMLIESTGATITLSLFSSVLQVFPLGRMIGLWKSVSS